MLTWYYLRELAAAGEENREMWVNRAVSLDSAVVPGLVDLLRQKDPTVCVNAEHALTGLARKWGAEDARTLRLAEEMHGRFGDLDQGGSHAARRETGAAAGGPGGAGAGAGTRERG